MNERERYLLLDPEDKMLDKLGQIGMPVTHEDFEYMEHRIYHDYVSTIDFEGMKDHKYDEDANTRKWVPYE